MSGNVQALAWAEQHGLLLFPINEDEGQNLVLPAVNSGSVSMMTYILDEYDRDLQFVESLDMLKSIFYETAKSGNISAINFMRRVHEESQIWLTLELRDGENYVDGMLRGLVEGVMDSGDVETFKHVLKIYMDMTYSSEKIFLKNFIYCLRGTIGSLALMEFLFERYAYHDIDISAEKRDGRLFCSIHPRKSLATVPKINQFVAFSHHHNISLRHHLDYILFAIGDVVDVSAIRHAIAVCKEELPHIVWRNRLGSCLLEQVENQNIPAVNFLLERSHELEFDPAYSASPSEGDFRGNILQIAKADENREMIIAIRKKCAELKLPLTPETPNAYGTNALQDPPSENASINEALTLPLNELLAAPVELKI